MIDRMCSEHKDRTERPRACHVCQRLAIERDIVVMLVDAALARGYHLRVHDGESDYKRSNDRAVILEQLGEVDDEMITVLRPKSAEEAGKPFQLVGRIQLVYGNDGYDVISDYTANPDTEALLVPVNAYAESLS